MSVSCFEEGLDHGKDWTSFLPYNRILPSVIGEQKFSPISKINRRGGKSHSPLTKGF